MFNIDKDIPKTAITTNQKKSESKYPFNFMGVGDSFFVPDGFLSTSCRPYGAMAARNRYRLTNSSSPLFKAANVEGGIRIWRIE